MEAKHQLHRQEAEDVPPEADEEVRPAKDNDGALLHLRHHRVHTLLLHQRLVRSSHEHEDQSRLQCIIHSTEWAIGCNPFSSIQFIFYNPISQITNLPQRALESVHI